MGEAGSQLLPARRWAPAASILVSWLFFVSYEALILVAISLPRPLAAPPGYLGAWLRAWADTGSLVLFPFALEAVLSPWSGLLAYLTPAVYFPVLIHLAFKWSGDARDCGSTRRVGWWLSIWAAASVVVAGRIALSGGDSGLIAVTRSAVVALLAGGWLIFGADAVAAWLLQARSRPVFVVFWVLGSVFLLGMIYSFVSAGFALAAM